MVKTRAKGYRGEHELEQLLSSLGFQAKRIPMSGQASHTGDMILKWGVNKCMIEIKSWARGFPEYKMLKHSDFVFKKTTLPGFKYYWLVVMPLMTFCSLISGQRILSKGEP